MIASNATTRTMVTFERDLDRTTDEEDAGPDTLFAAWHSRRSASWKVNTMPASRRDAPVSGTYVVHLAIINAGETPEGDRRHLLRIALDVPAGSVTDAVRHAQDLLDMYRARDETIRQIVPLQIDVETTIDHMPPTWPLGRRLTGLSTMVSTQDGNRAEAMAWQLNGGSWIVLAVDRAAEEVVVTREKVLPRTRNDILDVKIVRHRAARGGDGSSDPITSSELAARRPEIKRFDMNRGGFVLEASDNTERWRFEAQGLVSPAPNGEAEDPHTLGEFFLRTHSVK